MAKEKVSPTVRQMYKHRDVADGMLKDEYYRQGNTVMMQPDLIFGLELEIEGFRHGGAIDGFNYTEDGSLRDAGKEAITIPTKAKFLEEKLNEFFKQHRITPANYSERCSTHVHMNVQDTTIDQLKTLALLYQTVERLLFAYVGVDRKENIFCVPWYQSGLTSRLVEKMSKSADATISKWVKYSALNLLPVRTQGTVEFRHLHGTCDVALILGWVNILSALNKYAKDQSFEDLSKTILAMNTISNYDAFLTDVFREHTGKLTTPNYKELLSNGVVDTKLMLMTETEASKAANLKWQAMVDEVPLGFGGPAVDEVVAVRERMRAGAVGAGGEVFINTNPDGANVMPAPRFRTSRTWDEPILQNQAAADRVADNWAFDPATGAVRERAPRHTQFAITMPVIGVGHRTDTSPNLNLIQRTHATGFRFQAQRTITVRDPVSDRTVVVNNPYYRNFI